MPENSGKYILKDPVTFDGKTYTEVTLRTPRVRELRALDDYPGNTNKTIAVLSKLSGIPIGAFDEMLQWDFEGLLDLLTNLREARLPPTGESSSDGSPIVSISSRARSTE